MMPDERRFGILWLAGADAGRGLCLDGAFSKRVTKPIPGTSQEVVIETDRLLERYGGCAYGRKDQISHAFLDAELQQLQAMSRILPPIFLVVAAFLVNMTLSP
jgi:putative ABC transport system permease protein